MSPKEKRDVNRKLKIFNHAEQHGNIRKTCRYYGVSKTIFFSWSVSDSVWLIYGHGLPHLKFVHATRFRPQSSS